LTPFDFINSINNKDQLEWNDEAEKDYNAYIVNKGFSFYPDTVLQANYMNIYHDVPKKMQYDFFYQGIRKRKRWSKWYKMEKNEDIEMVQRAFGYNRQKAIQAMLILNDNDLINIRSKMEIGGVKNEQHNQQISGGSTPG
jgi:hypothetical protein